MAGVPSLLVLCQCWISLLQLFPTIYLSGYTGRIISQLGVWDVSVRDYPINWFVGMFGFWVINVINNIFILTVDLRRTNTYLGCIATQTTLNTGLTIANLINLLHFRDGVPQLVLYLSRDHNELPLLGICMLMTGIGSLCLFFICLYMAAVLYSHTKVSARQLWMMNTKDSYYGPVPCLEKPRALSALGCSRKTPVKSPIFFFTQGFYARLFFRRVRPSETRTYALVRNLFAIAAIAILLLRAITALLKAQNAISTRVISSACGDRATPIHSIHILTERPTYTGANGTLFGDVQITVRVTRSNTRENWEPSITVDCSSVWVQPFYYAPESLVTEGRILELFGCQAPHGRDLFISQSFTNLHNTLIYRIEIRSNGTRILDSHNPFIWLVNTEDIGRPDVFNRTPEVRAYLPPFQLVPGSHVESRAKLITRRLIKSSIMKEIILNAEPEYDRMSLYPIVSSSVVPLNNSDLIASATIRTSLAPGLMYLQTQVNKMDLNAPLNDVCDFVEDYRSSSVLDVIGSVGGLFALLQAMHVLLFGRPLLWGLTGAKLITPFGLLGACSSRGIKRRLRDEYYHSTSSGDSAEAFRIVKFLRDFVIEFGPADFDASQQPAERSSPSLRAVDNTTDSQAPLMPMNNTVMASSREREPMVDRHRADNAV